VVRDRLTARAVQCPTDNPRARPSSKVPVTEASYFSPGPNSGPAYDSRDPHRVQRNTAYCPREKNHPGRLRPSRVLKTRNSVHSSRPCSSDLRMPVRPSNRCVISPELVCQVG
jgi:hypothetical protein